MHRAPEDIAVKLRAKSDKNKCGLYKAEVRVIGAQLLYMLC